MTWKLLSSIIVAKMSRHVAQYMSRTQKGIGSYTRGAKHQLLVDRTVTTECVDWEDKEDQPHMHLAKRPQPDHHRE